MLEHYWRDVVPTKAPNTQHDNEAQRYWLLKFFNEPPAPMDSIEPVHIRQYLHWRVREAKKAAEVRYLKQHCPDKPFPALPPKYGQVRANRDKALISHVWNYARERGFTKAPNPCPGVKGFREEGRDAYVDDELFARVMKHAVRPLQLAMRLAHLTGQRPGDVLRMSETDINEGVLRVKQAKTKAKLRIVIEGELAVLLDEIRAYKATHIPKSKVRSLALLVSEKGEKMTAQMLGARFDAARDAAGIDKAAFQFRDLRAKAATDTDETSGTRGAQAFLGHATEAMTAGYIRHKVGKKVKPVR